MYIYQRLFFIKLLVVICESKMIPFIVHGTDASIVNYPHAVYLGVDCMTNKYTEAGNWMCGSSVLTQEVLLTAAHCLASCTKYSAIAVSAGNAVALKGVASSVIQFVIHIGYDEHDSDISKDIGLVKLTTRLRLGQNVKRIALMKNAPNIKVAELAGWGLVDEIHHTITEKLQHAKQYLIDDKSCISILQTLPEGCFCAAGKSDEGYAAPGDSGSGLIVNGYIQIGLVSYKIPKMSKTLVIYTNVTHYHSWITSKLKKLLCN